MTRAIEVSAADKWFGSRHVLADVILDVEAGAAIVVCGHGHLLDVALGPLPREEAQPA